MKKKTLLTVLVTMLALSVSAQIKIEVSETVELMSILSRTAGFQEYHTDKAGQYTKDTEAWFSPYKEHPIISYYQGLRSDHSVSYDAVMSMAIHLEIQQGKVCFLGEKSDLDERWENVDIDDFMLRLNQFYTDTRFHAFFEQQSNFYQEGLKSFEENVMSYFHQDWYGQFYGTESTERFHIVIGFTYGDLNNGVARQLKGHPKEVFAICGYTLSPTTNQPAWDAALLIHEFNHSFVNPLLDNPTNVALLQKIGMKLFQLSQPEMEKQAYRGWETVINESVVRAAVFIYMLDNKLVSKSTSNFMFNETWRKGFRWLPELVTSLRYYASHREQYPTLNDYYPEIARCLNSYFTTEAERLNKPLQQ